MAERQVEHIDAVGGLVADRPLHRGDDVARLALTQVVQHAQADELRAGRDALDLRLVAADQAGHMRAVPVGVEGG